MDIAIAVKIKMTRLHLTSSLRHLNAEIIKQWLNRHLFRHDVDLVQKKFCPVQQN